MAICADNVSTADLATAPCVTKGVPVYCVVELMKTMRPPIQGSANLKDI